MEQVPCWDPCARGGADHGRHLWMLPGLFPHQKDGAHRIIRNDRATALASPKFPSSPRGTRPAPARIAAVDVGANQLQISLVALFRDVSKNSWPMSVCSTR